MKARKWADPRAKELATIALHAVVERDDWDAAAAALTTAYRELGGSGVADIILLLCNTIIAANKRVQGVPAGDPPAVTRPAWLNTETGRVQTDAASVPASARWAGQLVAARAAMDQPAFEALLSALPTDRAERSEHVARLLTAAAIAVKAERGTR